MAKSHLQDTSSVEFENLIQSVYGAFKSKTIYTACELGIFEVLHDGKMSAKEVSGKCSTNQAATIQMLNALVSLQLLQKHCKEEPPGYSNTQTTEKFLVKSSPDSIRGFIVHCNRAFKVFDNVAWAIREGTNQWQRTFGHSSSDLNPFKSFYATKEERISFLDGMRASCKLDVSRLLAAFDLHEFNHLCDLGGYTGDVGYAACSIYPKMKITVLDLPSVIELSPQFRPSADECPNQENVSFLSADFFTDELPSANLYVLTRVLYDWDEDKMNLLLGKIFKSLPSGGGLLIREILLRDDKTGPLIANLRSLVMLAVCSRGARERSGLEYREILEGHGFMDVQTKVTQGMFLDAIFARKPW